MSSAPAGNSEAVVESKEPGAEPDPVDAHAETHQEVPGRVVKAAVRHFEGLAGAVSESIRGRILSAPTKRRPNPRSKTPPLQRGQADASEGSSSSSSSTAIPKVTQMAGPPLAKGYSPLVGESEGRPVIGGRQDMLRFIYSKPAAPMNPVTPAGTAPPLPKLPPAQKAVVAKMPTIPLIPKGGPPPKAVRGKAVVAKRPNVAKGAVAKVTGVRREAPAGEEPGPAPAKARVHMVEHQGYEAACMCVETEQASAKSGSVFIATGYKLWLSEMSPGADKERLTWKERKLGKEVPKGLQGEFFKAAQAAEIQRWWDEGAMRRIPAKEGTNIISCRFVNRWQEKPIEEGPQRGQTEMRACSRLCGRGFEDKHWWIQRVSPTARRHIQRMCTHKSVQRQWAVWTRDARRAFLQVKVLDRRVCIKPPPEANEGPDVLWELQVPVYGIGDALRRCMMT